MKIAIYGASGFVGLRLVEKLHLGSKHQVVPVVHAFKSLAVLSRFNLPWHVASHNDVTALATAFEGCDAVIHAALGDAKAIQEMAPAIYQACNAAKVKRLVAISSTAVHGLMPQPGTQENTPVLTNQYSEYNTAKARAELRLAAARKKGSTELVQIRPGIIYGPRSRLLTDVCRQLLNETAYLVEGGKGVCNAIYVDNLVEALLLACDKPDIDGEVFFINDEGTHTWEEIYRYLASALAVSSDGIHHVGAPAFKRSPSDRFARFAAQDWVQRLLPALPAVLKRSAKAVAAALPPPSQQTVWKMPAKPGPAISEELSELHRCAYRFPTTKIQEKLGFTPSISTQEGLRRNVEWMKHSGVLIA